MGVEVPPGFGQAAFRFSLVGDPEEMITTMGVDLGLAGGDFVEAANNVCRAFGDQFPASQIDSSWTWRGVRLWVGQDGGSVIPYDSVGFTIAGTSIGSGPVQNTALLQRKVTAMPGRAGRGRMYWPAFCLDSAGYTAAGMLETTTFTDLSERFNDLFTTLAGGSAPGQTFEIPVVLLHDSATAPTPLVTWPLQQQLATQRRRLRR